MRMISSIYGRKRRDPERVRREGWRELGILAVAEDDPRLSWHERELVRRLGERLYGRRHENDEGANR